VGTFRGSSVRDQDVADGAGEVFVQDSAAFLRELGAGGQDGGPGGVLGVQQAEVACAGAEGVVPRREVDLGRG
jgi:hypothetical protein